MEISGLNSNFLKTDAASGAASETRMKTLATGLENGAGDREGLAKAAQEFEGVFLNQLLKAMRATVPENEMFNSGGPSKFYQQMHDAEMAKALASGDTGMGIANLIVQQFESSLDQNPEQDKAEGKSKEPLAIPLVSNQAALEQYQAFSVSRPGAGRMITLRRLAAEQGQAVADTLRRFEGSIHAAARENHIDPALVLAVVMEESGGDPEALSNKGAVGLMQLMPATAAELGVSDPRQPAQNIAGGTKYLAQMLEKFDGDRDLALAAYNAGPGNVVKAGRQVPDFPETQKYLERVEARYRELSGGMELAD